MKDLSKFNIPKKKTENNKETEKPQQPVNNKKKKLVIIAIVCLLSIAVGSKLINKHLKKKKAQEQALLAESPANKKETALESKETTTQQKSDENAKSNSKKMVFTFYDNLKNESVEVDAAPATQRAQYTYQYIYQVASFRNMNETSYYVKKMKSKGLEPKFKQVGGWIRMYIGPYDSSRAIAPDIIKLQRMGLNGGFTREISRTKDRTKRY